ALSAARAGRGLPPRRVGEHRRAGAASAARRRQGRCPGDVVRGQDVRGGARQEHAGHAYFHGEKVAYGLLVQLVLEGQPRSVVERVLRFASEVGLPITLAEIGLGGLPRELLQQVASRATAKGETIHNEPFEVRPDMVSDAILAADALGRAWQKNRAGASQIQVSPADVCL